ncbi:hypothetical protein HPB50_019084 [Hyalomma asiaticum]|uniref:Uncharacterized protein n=1 Tax=Hyalomma asiaticum TaxID=266040 RepID=A0ACB7RK29_HYAAI|nr:hypothetical protein HPB50_019084 [Hyalomma asiaticum]
MVDKSESWWINLHYADRAAKRCRLAQDKDGRSLAMLAGSVVPARRRGEEEEAWRVRVTLYEAQRPHLVSTPESPVGPDQLPLLAHSAANMASQPDGYVRQQSADRQYGIRGGAWRRLLLITASAKGGFKPGAGKGNESRPGVLPLPEEKPRERERKGEEDVVRMRNRRPALRPVAAFTLRGDRSAAARNAKSSSSGGPSLTSAAPVGRRLRVCPRGLEIAPHRETRGACTPGPLF